MSQVETTNTLQRLAELSARPEVANLWFHDQEITLDGYYFSSCRFDRCRLNINSTNFELYRCFIDDKTVFIYGSEPIKIVRAFNLKNGWIRLHATVFAAEKHPDDTFSVHGRPL